MTSRDPSPSTADESNALESDWDSADPDSKQTSTTRERTDDGWGHTTDTLERRECLTFSDIRETVLTEFDQRIWNATEVVLSTQATLLLNDERDCTGVMLIGNSGAGKTTVLDFFKQAQYNGESLAYLSDDMTPAAFLSHDASREEDELQQIDLLPKIRHKMLLNPDMAGWFGGEFANIRKKMSLLARTMDGNGLSTDSGAHGQRGYQGDYRFALAAATTPLDSRAWDAMGKVGNRLISYHLPEEDNIQKAVEDVVEGRGYDEKVRRCQDCISKFLENRWSETGGYSSINWDNEPEGVEREVLEYLTRLVQYGRAPLTDGTPQREGGQRIAGALYNVARGRALLNQRNEIHVEDLEMCAPIALSTMHKERRGIVRAVVDPDTGNPITSREVTEHDATTASRKTLLKRMDLLQDLGLGDVTVGDSSRDTKQFVLHSDFIWPDDLQFPRFW